MRVTLAHDGERFVATPTGSQSSVVLTSMARADAAIGLLGKLADRLGYKL